MLRNILLLVQYEGTDFHGWQQQDGRRTVQGTLAEALQGLVHHELILYGSSRTDSGVHARALPVNFETERSIPPRGFFRGLNANLPDDVAVVDVREVPVGWRARHEAVAKTYHYRYQLGRGRLPLYARQSWYVRREELDVAAMREAAQHLLGDHLFDSFRSSRCDSKSTQRRIFRFELVEEPPHLLRLEVTGNAFLRNMVRIIAGTLFEVGEGRRTPGSVVEVLAARDRTRAGRTAPANGLTLHDVHFEGYPRIGKRDTPPGPTAPQSE